MITTAHNTALNQMAIIRARMEGHTVYFKDFDDGDSKYHVSLVIIPSDSIRIFTWSRIIQ